MFIPGISVNKINSLKYIAICLVYLLFFSQAGIAGDKLYFGAIVEKNDQGQNQFLLEWGPLEGGIPQTIERFRLYRSENQGAFARLGEEPMSYGTPATAADLDKVIKAHITIEARFKELVSVLADMDPSVDTATYHTYLHKIIHPDSADFDPLKRMFLIRRFPEIAIATGLGYIDRDLTVGTTYTYLLTAYKTDGTESRPVGQSRELSPETLTIMPAPKDFRQVFVSGCSELRKNLDDNRIHFSWDTRDSPDELGFKVLVYGYDIYWSDKDQGVINPRNPSQLEKLTRLNDVPIIASGAPPEQAPDNFLSKDDGSTHTTGAPWERGQTYYYYIFSRDIGGHYSQETAPLKAAVPDREPPVAPFNVHTVEMKGTGTDQARQTPRLSLVWDQVNGRNYARHYGGVKNISNYDKTSVTYTYKNSEDIVRIKKMDVDHYRIFRFDTPESASQWGVDMDGDLWPDLQEEKEGTDPCDADSHPPVTPAAYVISINQDDASHQQEIGTRNDYTQMVYVDKTIEPDNDVHWYRILAVDKDGNQSSLSAPIRGVLFDRSQPITDDITLETQQCIYRAVSKAECEGQEICLQDASPDTFLTLVDKTKTAFYYELFRYCSNGTEEEIYNLMRKDKLTGENTCIDYKMLNPGASDCSTVMPPSCPFDKVQGYVVRFYDENKKFLAESEKFSLADFCARGGGCIELIKQCLFVPVYYPGRVITEWPLNICVNLSQGQMARIYHQTADGMSPLGTIPTAASSGEYCHELTDLDTIVPSDLCLGVRIFSPNHVGSAMQYLPCVRTNAGGEVPVAPIIDDVVATEQDGTPFFTLTWGCRTEGLSAFLISMTSNGETRYLNDWAMEKNNAGQFTLDLELTEADLGRKWCFKIQALDTAMQKSEWSYEKCGFWEPGIPERLPWPKVRQPLDGGDMSAFVPLGGQADSPYHLLPLIVVSEMLESESGIFNLNEQLFCTAADEQDCITDGPFTINNYSYSQCLCNFLEQQLLFDSFIIYFQEEGKDYVQAGPLIEGFNCTSVRNDKTCESSMHDPYIFLRNFDADMIGGGNDVSIEASEGTRLVYLDRYPHPAGARIRYKIASVHPESGELLKIYTTNWVNIP